MRKIYALASTLWGIWPSGHPDILHWLGGKQEVERGDSTLIMNFTFS